MPYTLVKGLLWVVLALLIGVLIGWLLRSIKSRRQVARARVAGGVGGPADANEVERLRIRLAELEPIVVERDRLRAELQTIVAEQNRVSAEVESARPEPSAHASTWQPFAPQPPPTADVRSAATVLGRQIELDDLCVVVGVSPAIESLCRRIGIRTWWDLAATEPSLLRTMLTDAGLSVAVDDSASWPRQARLLAEGRWTDFKALTDELAAGRPVD